MTGSVLRFVVALALVVPAPAVLTAQAPQSESIDLSGEWLGEIEGPNRAIPITVRLARDSSGVWAGSIDIPAAGAVGLPLTGTIEDARVTLTIHALPGPPTFTGELSDSARALSGVFRESAEVLPFSLRRAGAGPGVRPAGTVPSVSAVPDRPQNPKPPLPYETRDVVFRNDVAGIGFAGTLVVPPGTGPFPAVVLVSGSGPQDRDETFAGHRPFLVIADHLARHGVASLRFDDRGVGGSEGDLRNTTHVELASDITAAVDFLAAQPRIDAAAIGVIGHSEGGLTGPRAAAADDRIAFLVLIAPPGEPLAELSLRQNLAALRARGFAAELIDRVVDGLREDYLLIQDASIGGAELHAQLRTRMLERRANYTDAERAALQVNDAAFEIMLGQATSPWFRSLLREDPGQHLRSLGVRCSCCSVTWTCRSMRS
jgi:uncharacterized protein